MELKVFDRDLMTKDDPVLSVLLDVGTLQVGTQRKSFSLSTQVKPGKVGTPPPPFWGWSFGAPLLQGEAQESQVTSPRSSPSPASLSPGQKHSFL